MSLVFYKNPKNRLIKAKTLYIPEREECYFIICLKLNINRKSLKKKKTIAT